MGIFRRSFLTICVCFLVSSGSIKALFSQDISLPFKSYSTVDGLSQASISAVFQDSKGFIWLGSQNGVDRFDGKYFKSFELNKILKAPTIRFISVIAEDAGGNIWIGTRMGGLWQYDPRSGSFEVFLESSENDSAFDSNNVLNIEVDTTGNVFVLLASGSILTCQSCSSIAKFSKIEGSTPDIWESFRAIEFDADNQLFGVSRMGQTFSLKLDENGGPGVAEAVSQWNSSSDFPAIWSSHMTAQGGLVVGTADGGLFFYETKTQRSSKFTITHDGKSVGRISSIDDDGKGRLFLGTDHGLYIGTWGSDDFKRVRRNGDYSNSCDVIWSVLLDESDMLWGGTYGCGFFEQQAELLFEVFRNEKENSNSLSGNGIWTFDEDTLGGIWIATAENGISRFDPKTRSFDRYSELTHREIDSDNVIDLMIDSKMNLWVSNFAGVSIYKLIRRGDKLILGDRVRELKFDSHVWQFREITGGRVIIGTGLSGAFVFDPFDGEVRSLLDYSKLNPELGKNGVQGIHENADGAIWLGTFGAGLLKYDPKSETVISYLDRPDEFPFGTVVGPIVRGANQDELWIGGYNGLIRFNPRSEEYTLFDKANSNLPDDTIYAIVLDGNQNIWVSSDKGLSLLEKSDSTFVNFTVFDGLQDMEFNMQAAMLSRNNEIYFGGINGFNIIRPDKIDLDQSPSEIKFISLRILNKNIDSIQDGKFDDLLPYGNAIRLDHDDAFFEIGYSSRSFKDRDQHTFQYKLQGLDDVWLDNGTKRSISYTNLDPGRYELQVRSSFRNGNWSEPSSIEIKVLPPWYKTWWATILWLLLALLLFWFITRSLLHREKQAMHKNELQRKQQELERAHEANEKLRELDKLKSVFLANMSHEIRTPLTSIIGFADYLNETLPEEHVEYAQYILNGGNRLMETINSVLDLAQLEGRAMKLHLSELDLAEMTPIYLSVFDTIKPLKGEVPLSFENVNGGPIFAKVDQGAYQRIVVNLVGNARKFTQEGSIKVRLNSDESEATLEVIDTGIGIEKEYLDNIFDVFSQESAGANRSHEGNGLGLAITKQLVEMMDGRIEVESAKGKGSTFRVCLPLSKNGGSEKQT